MSHIITQNDIDELRKSGSSFATQMMFGSFGKGTSKRLTAVWNVFTDERYFVVEDHGYQVFSTTEFKEAVRAYNEVNND